MLMKIDYILFSHKSLESQLKHCKTLIYYIYFMLYILYIIYILYFIYQRILIVYTFDILF